MLESQLIYLYYKLPIKTQPTKVLKAVLGHLIATMNYTSYNNLTCEILQDIRDYVLSNRVDVPQGLHVFYWLFPYPDIILVKPIVNFLNFMERQTCSIFKFYPLAFCVVYGDVEHSYWEDLVSYAQDIAPEQYCDVNIDMTRKALPYDFPEYYDIQLVVKDYEGCIAKKY